MAGDPHPVFPRHSVGVHDRIAGMAEAVDAQTREFPSFLTLGRPQGTPDKPSLVHGRDALICESQTPFRFSYGLAWIHTPEEAQVQFDRFL